jgi:hypothetical protein
MSLGKQLARLFEFKVISVNEIWAVDTSYLINNVVSKNGVYYKCIQAHTSASTNEPGAGVDEQDYWQELDSEYLHISGVTSFSPSQEKNDADTTDFDSEGWIEHMVASRGLSFEVEGYYIEDENNGVRDIGQERVEEIGQLVGSGSTSLFRIIDPSGTPISFEGSVDSPMFGQSTGGGNDDPAGWSFTLTITSDPRLI